MVCTAWWHVYSVAPARLCCSWEFARCACVCVCVCVCVASFLPSFLSFFLSSFLSFLVPFVWRFRCFGELSVGEATGFFFPNLIAFGCSCFVDGVLLSVFHSSMAALLYLCCLVFVEALAP